MASSKLQRVLDKELLSWRESYQKALEDQPLKPSPLLEGLKAQTWTINRQKTKIDPWDAKILTRIGVHHNCLHCDESYPTFTTSDKNVGHFASPEDPNVFEYRGTCTNCGKANVYKRKSPNFPYESWVE